MVVKDEKHQEIFFLAGGAADTWQGGLSGEHQLRGVCQDGPRPIEPPSTYGGEGGGREGRVTAFAQAEILLLS